MYQDINGQQLRELSGKEGENGVVIDVRTPEEVAEGMIPGAKHINLMGPDFIEQMQQLDRDKTYFMVCRSGGRSATACGAMAQSGFTKLYNLQGGMMDWDGDVA